MSAGKNTQLDIQLPHFSPPVRLIQHGYHAVICQTCSLFLPVFNQKQSFESKSPPSTPQRRAWLRHSWRSVTTWPSTSPTICFYHAVEINEK